MKVLFLVAGALIITQSFFDSCTAFAEIERPVLKAGLYEMISGNESSICPQQVKPYYWDGDLTGIEVTYVGDCYEMGPYVFGCEPSGEGQYSCGDSQISYTITASDRFRWENRTYSFWGEFRWSGPRVQVESIRPWVGSWVGSGRFESDIVGKKTCEKVILKVEESFAKIHYAVSATCQGETYSFSIGDVFYLDGKLWYQNQNAGAYSKIDFALKLHDADNGIDYAGKIQTTGAACVSFSDSFVQDGLMDSITATLCKM